MSFGIAPSFEDYQNDLQNHRENFPNSITDHILNNAFKGVVASNEDSITDYFTGKKDFEYILDLLEEQYNKNLALQNSANAFSSEEAKLTRDFNALEASKNRAWQSQEAKLVRDYNAEQAEINRVWQQYMSNTAVQRMTADYKNAGLNPYLAYSQGGAPVTGGSSASATVPAGASASAQNASSHSNSVHASLGRVTKVADLLGTLVNSAVSIFKFL